MSNILEVHNVSKQYRLGTVGTGTLSHDLNRWFHKVRGKEDPYLKIGSANDRSAKADSDYVWALQDISFNVKEGEVLGIIGKNGAGKSTLLKILSRVTGPTTGSIKAYGRIASLLEVGTGFHPELTGRENIYLNGAILGMSKAEIRSKFDEIVDFSGCERYIDTPVKRYSSGMYVRLAFAVAAHLEPEILIVDEVLAVGDAEFQKKALGKMQDISKGQGRTVLFVSHNMGTMSQLCGTCILLQSGQMIANGNTTDVINKYLSSQGNENTQYTTPIADRINKSYYFDKIIICDSNQISKSTFGFNENISIVIKLNIVDYHNKSILGIGLQDKYSNRVFTIVKNISEFYNGERVYNLIVTLPKSIIAPNLYSFVFAVFEQKDNIHCLADNVCAIKVVDTGSELSSFEGVDYGSVIISAKWDIQNA